MDDLPASGRKAANREDLQQQFGAAQVLEVVRPQPGELRIVDLDRSTDVAFGFSLEEARIIALDVDIIIAFTDGGKLLLPNLGLLATGLTPPSIRFAGRPVSWERVFSAITEVSIGEATATLTNLGRSSDAGKEDNAPEPKTEALATPQAPQPAPLVRLQSTHSGDLGIQAASLSEPVSIRSVPLDIPKPVYLGAGSNTRFADPNSNTGAGYYLLAGLKVDLAIDLYNQSKARDYKENADGSRDIYYAPGGLGSDSSPTYVAQSTARLPIVASTANNDVLYLDDPKLVPAGYAYRKIVMTLESQTNGFEVTKVTLSGFPEGVSLVGYPQAAGQYVIPVDLTAGGKVEFGLLYALPGPTSSKDSAGFYNYFQLNVTSTAANSKGDYRDLDTTVRFGVREVSGEADMEYTNLSGKVNVLWSNPPGAVADGGAGDDTIYSSSGADTITGGVGSDLVSYANSATSVTVNLGLRARSQSYAQGDVFLDDIERLTGSAFADSLLGNASGNYIKTGGGADTVDGDGGTDTVDFSASVSGVTINLASTAAHKGGDAKGVVLINIENIVGSATGANSLVGTTGDNYLEGGALNDTFRGEGGFDTFVGGSGVNVVDFSTAVQAMSIDLASSVVLLQDIAKIYGSNFGDTFAGDGNDNFIVGGTGNDSMLGRAGADTLLGGGGDDSFRDAAGSDSYAGGVGNDLFLSGSAYQPRSDYDGGDGFDTIDFSDFNPGTGKLTMTLFPDGSGRFAWDGTAATGEFSNMEAMIGSKFVDNVLEGNDNINHLVGGGKSDTLAGMSGADTISGGGGNDSLSGGGDAGDTVDYGTASAGLDVTMTPGAYTAHVGTDETDTLSGFVNILGSSFDDRINGDSQSSVLSGADGNDTISPGLGDDTVDGGRGQDVLDLAYLGSSPVSLAMSASFVLSPTGQNVLAINMEGVIGTSGDDTFVADSEHAGYLVGAAGNDLLIATGDGGGATFAGGAGSDTLDYSQVAQAVSVNMSATSAAILSLNGVRDGVLGIETFIAGAFNDTIAAIDDTVAHRFLGNAGDDSLVGGAASDSLLGGIGEDTLAGGAGDDLLDAGDGADSVFGGAGNDSLLDTAGNDSLDGGDGAADEISYAGRASGISVAFNNASPATLVVSATEMDQIVNIENITGSTDGDTIWAAGDTVGHRFLGLEGSDSLGGGLGADTLIGGADSDTLVGSAGGNDSIDGGADVDRLDYTLTSGGLTATFSGAGAGVVTASGKTDTFANIEIFIGSAGDDSIVGSTAADTILGSAGADTVFAGLGNDSLDGGDSGGDLISYAGTALAISVNFASANVASVSIAGGEVDTIVNFENVIAGTGNDTLSAAGDTATHSFSGDAGNDSLIGGVADDTLSGGAGADTLIGGLGNDRFDGGDGLADVVTYEARSEAISVAFVSGTTVTVNVGTSEVDTIINVENATGGSGNDTLSAIGDATSYTLTGNTGDDSLAGGSGADMVLGGTGADTFAASVGNDTMDGGDGVDRLSFASQAGPVQIVAGTGGLSKATLFGSDGITTVGLQDLRNFEWITGTSLNDSLVAFSDANTLDGGAGHDSILGTAAGDSLFGGTGNDTIVAAGVGDTVEGGAGTDSLSGDQNDVLSFATGTGVSIDLVAGRAKVTDGTDTVSGFDYVVGSSTASNTFFGDDDANTLVGGAANDYFVGRLGSDSFVGGGGSDTLDYGTRTQGVVATLGATGSIVLSASDTARFAGISRFTFSSGDDTIVSGATSESVNGATGNDSFIASVGGADTFDADGGSDYLSYLDSAFSSVRATLAGTGFTTATVTLAAGGVRLDSIANFEAIGGASGNDSFLGDAANNQTFMGSGGNDTFNGGAGGIDFADYYANPGATSMVVDMISATQSAVLYGPGGVVLKVDRLINIEGIRGAGSGNASLFGDNLGNKLIGGDGADSIVGRLGSDTIGGGLGNDSLFGSTSGAVADAGDVLDYSYTNNVTTPVYGLTYDMAAATSGVLVTVGLGDIDFVGSFRNVIGSRGDDSIVVDSLANTVDLGAGNDTVSGGGAGDSFIGGAGNDVLDYSSAAGTIIVTLAGASAATVTVGGFASGVVKEFEGFIGGAGNDLLGGDDGANTFAGGAGADTLNMNGGDDSAFGGTGNDSVLGGAGADTLAGGDGVDTVLGGADNDCLSGGLGNDSLDGGTGADALSYGDAQAGVTVALTGTTVTTTVSIGAERDIVTNFEIFVGSTFADSILGSAADETLAGGAGADTLVAGGGSNSLAGGAGNDLMVVDSSTGSDTLDGGDGIDTIDFSQFTTGVSVILGASGMASTAYVNGRTIVLVNFENITGGSGNDTLGGNELDNVLDGGAGDDTLAGGVGGDTLIGGTGNDTLRGGEGSNYLKPGGQPGDVVLYDDLTGGLNQGYDSELPNVAGTDFSDTLVGLTNSAFTFNGALGDDCLIGNNSNDSLFGGLGNDTLLGSGGNDTLDGGVGNDFMDGGTGTADEATYATRTVGINATFATGTTSALIIDSATGELDRIINVENITGGSGNDTISAAGDSVAHVLRGGAGDDCLTGGSGDDTLDAGLGRDNLSGGLGNDLFIPGAANQTFDGGDGTDVVDLSGFSGVSMVLGANGSDLSVALPGGGFLQLVNIENIIAGAGNDTLVGNSATNSIIGDGGDDSIFGNGNNDTLLGGTGNDTLFGGGGNDSLDGGAGGSDLASYDSQNIGISAVFGASGTLTVATGATDTDLAINIENLAGSTGADTITALDTAAHILSGLDGNDSLGGGSGADTLLGGAGSDTLVGGLGNDSLDGGDALDDAISYETRSIGVSLAFNLGSALVSVSASETDQIVNIENVFGGTGSDTLSGAGDSVAHLLSGGAGNDSLLGGLGADTLLGGTGNDTVIASFGNDSLDGGAGNDVISYAALSATQSVSMAFDGTSTILATLFDGGVSVGLARLANFEFFTGSDGGDTQVGDNVADTLDGGAGDDSLAGFGGADTLIGGLGNDTLRGGLGNDSLDGGAGTADFASFEDSTVAVSLVLAVSAGLSTATITGGELERLINIENLLGSALADTLAAVATDTTAHMYQGASGNDSLFGGAAADTLDGGDGNDRIAGGLGNNSLSGGLGDDTILGGTGADTIDGGDGADTIAGGGGLDNLSGGAGNDTILGTASAETISGGDGNDTLTGGNGLDSLMGGAGNDLLTGGTTADTITGGDGDDTISTGGGGDSVSGDAGNDSIFGTAAAETLTGGDGNDSINGGGGAGADSLVGGLGDEFILGGTGADSLSGGLGNDTLDGGAGTTDNASYTYTGAPTLLIASGQSLAGGFNTFNITGGGELDTLINIETLRLGAASTTIDLSALVSSGAVLRVDGSAATGNDSILGSQGADSLLGGAGNDTLAGGLGNDVLSGGTGTDWADFSYLTSTTDTFTLTRVNDASFNATAAVGADVDSLLSIEAVKLGSGVNSVGMSALSATAAVMIDGSQGAFDSISTGAGADTLIGGAGADTFSGGAGNDRIDGGGGGDLVSYAYTTTGISLVLGVTARVSATDVDTLINIENVIGGSGKDTIQGDGNDNTIFGGAGNDRLLASFGNDTFDGGTGTGDILNFADLSAQGYVQAYTGSSLVNGVTAYTFSVTNGTTTFTDVMWNVEGVSGLNFVPLGATAGISVSLAGLPFAAGIIGSTYADTMTGGAGDDTFQGGGGNDTIDGSAGTDTVDFSYLTAGVSLNFSQRNTSGADVINTWAIGSDVVRAINVEGILTGSGNDTIIGTQTSAFTNYATWRPGVTVNTGAGDDYVKAAYGGGMYYDGGTGNDIVDFSAMSLGWTIDLTANSFGVGSYQTYDNYYTSGGQIFGFETIIGSSGADAIMGGDTNAENNGANSIFGGAGADTIGGSGGADTLDGGTGVDYLDVSYSTTGPGVTIDLRQTGFITVTVDAAAGDVDVVTNFEGLIGGSGNDFVFGTTTGTRFNGNGGDDTFIAASSNDVVSGGVGNDSLDGGGGTDTIDYGYVASGQTVSIVALNSRTWGATVSTGGDIDTLVNFENINFWGNGAAGINADMRAVTTGTNLLMYGTSATDTFLGGGGNDTFIAFGGGSDSLDGGGGNDAFYEVLTSQNGPVYANSTLTINADGASGVLRGVAQGVTQTLNFANFETIFGSNDGDKFIGSSTATTVPLYFSADPKGTIYGNDTMDDGNAATTGLTLDGFRGNDVFFIRSASTKVVETYLAGTKVSINTTLNTLDLSNTQYNGGVGGIDNLTYYDTIAYNAGAWSTTLTSGAFTGIGNNADNLITGGNGGNSLSGGLGSDTLVGGTGADYLRGGDASEGGNLYPVAAVSDLSNANGWNKPNSNTTPNQIAGPSGLDSGTNADYYSSVTPGNNTLYQNIAVAGGQTYRSTYYAKAVGGTSWVQLYTNAGFDAVNTWINFDIVNGVVGNKGSAVTAGNYSISAVNNGWYAITLTSTATSSTANGQMMFEVLDSNVTARNGWGGSTSNQTVALWGESMQVVAMDDSLVGGAGADTLMGGNGNDTMDGGSGTGDLADYSYATGGVTVTLAATGAATVSVGATDQDTLSNIEGVIGGSGNDMLTGNSSANFLSGGLGDDTLWGGGAGTDTLFGGGGNDLLRFTRSDLTGMSFDGGAGTDTLKFELSGSFTGAQFSAAITGVEVLDFTKTGAAIAATLTSADVKALGLSALNRDLTIRTDGNDAISLNGSTLTAGNDYFVNPGDAGASVVLHVISSAST